MAVNKSTHGHSMEGTDKIDSSPVLVVDKRKRILISLVDLERDVNRVRGPEEEKGGGWIMSADDRQHPVRKQIVLVLRSIERPELNHSDGVPGRGVARAASLRRRLVYVLVDSPALGRAVLAGGSVRVPQIHHSLKSAEYLSR